MLLNQFRGRLFQCLGGKVRHYGWYPGPSVESAIEEQYDGPSTVPSHEEVQEPFVGSEARLTLVKELTDLCRRPCVVAISANGESSVRGEHRTQPVPFDTSRVAAHYYATWRGDIQDVIDATVTAQPRWERTPIASRIEVFEETANMLANDFRSRVIAAAMIGTGMTAIQAEHNICQLVDYLRFNCKHLRDLTQNWGVLDNGLRTKNRQQYHGLEGFWAAITPYDSFAYAAQLALTPALMGNTVVWKPADESVLVCYRIFEALCAAGLPAGVINFVPADKHNFLDMVVSSPYLAGITFGGKSSTLETIYKRCTEDVERKSAFPRIVGTGSGKGFHLIHSSADLENAVSCTARAAFEMSGQMATSCARVLVAQSISCEFMLALRKVAETLMVCSPLDYRCFTSALASHSAWKMARAALDRARRDPAVSVVCGGRCAGSAGWYISPAVLAVEEVAHPALTMPLRAPVVAIETFPDGDLMAAAAALSHSPYALTGAVFAQDVSWAKDAVAAVRDFAGTLAVNERCSLIQPGLQALGGTRKSGSGAKAGSISYLLQFCNERSISECLLPTRDVTYSYMDELPPTQPIRVVLEE